LQSAVIETEVLTIDASETPTNSIDALRSLAVKLLPASEGTIDIPAHDMTRLRMKEYASETAFVDLA